MHVLPGRATVRPHVHTCPPPSHQTVPDSARWTATGHSPIEPPENRLETHQGPLQAARAPSPYIPPGITGEVLTGHRGRSALWPQFPLPDPPHALQSLAHHLTSFSIARPYPAPLPPERPLRDPRPVMRAHTPYGGRVAQGRPVPLCPRIPLPGRYKTGAKNKQYRYVSVIYNHRGEGELGELSGESPVLCQSGPDSEGIRGHWRGHRQVSGAGVGPNSSREGACSRFCGPASRCAGQYRPATGEPWSRSQAVQGEPLTLTEPTPFPTRTGAGGPFCLPSEGSQTCSKNS